VNRLLVGAGGLAAGIVAALAVIHDRGGTSVPPNGPTTAAPGAPAAVASGGPGELPSSAGSRQAAPQPAVPAAPAPSFDVVRISPEGNVVIAGRAAPRAEVTVRDGDATLGKVTADARGEWVLVPEKPLPPGNRSLSLSETLPGKGESVASTGDVLVAVPEPQGNASGATANASSGALALLVPRTAGEIAWPLQVPGPGAASAAKSGGSGAASGHAPSLDIVEYDAAGRIALAGHADPGAALDIYLGDRLLAHARAGADGRWSAKPGEEVAPGSYQLRVDQLGSEGKVVGSISLPFDRAAPGAALAQGQSFTVQPGNSLWRIARRSYGSGLRYAVIYAANRDQITNPDLIYPGEVVRLPAAN